MINIEYEEKELKRHAQMVKALEFVGILTLVALVFYGGYRYGLYSMDPQKIQQTIQDKDKALADLQAKLDQKGSSSPNCPTTDQTCQSKLNDLQSYYNDVYNQLQSAKQQNLELCTCPAKEPRHESVAPRRNPRPRNVARNPQPTYVAPPAPAPSPAPVENHYTPPPAPTPGPSAKGGTEVFHRKYQP